MKQISYTTTWDLDRLLLQEIQKNGLSRNAQVLNIACEHARVPKVLEGFIDGHNIYGVDLGATQSDSQIIQCDVDRDALPFNNDRFDLVISLWGLEHFASDKIFEEAARVLKPGGTFIFLTPNVAHPIFFTNKIFGNRFARWYYKHVMKSPYDPHVVKYRLNRVSVLRKATLRNNYSDFHFTLGGPGHLKYYVRENIIGRFFLRLAEFLVSTPLTYRVKPYILGRLIAK